MHVRACFCDTTAILEADHGPVFNIHKCDVEPWSRKSKVGDIFRKVLIFAYLKWWSEAACVMELFWLKNYIRHKLLIKAEYFWNVLNMSGGDLWKCFSKRLNACRN